MPLNTGSIVRRAGATAREHGQSNGRPRKHLDSGGAAFVCGRGLLADEPPQGVRGRAISGDLWQPAPWSLALGEQQTADEPRARLANRTLVRTPNRLLPDLSRASWRRSASGSPNDWLRSAVRRLGRT